MLRSYEIGTPCKYGQFLGRIVGYSVRGGWIFSGNNKIPTRPDFCTPNNDSVFVDFYSLEELTTDDLYKLYELEQKAVNNCIKPYVGKITQLLRATGIDKKILLEQKIAAESPLCRPNLPQKINYKTER